MQLKAINPRPNAVDGISGLIADIARGEHAAFSRLHELTRHKMRQTARSILPSSTDVDDVLQDAYVKIWRHAASFDPSISSPISWMSVIVRNTARDFCRRKALPTADLELANDVAVMEEQDDFDYAHARQIAGNVIARLPEDRRNLLSLAYLEGWSREALSQSFGVPISTIKTWLRRTLDDVKIDCATLARRPAYSLVTVRKR